MKAETKQQQNNEILVLLVFYIIDIKNLIMKKIKKSRIIL